MVHKVLCIISKEAKTERGEWIVSKSFDHTFGSAASLKNLQESLDILARIQPWAKVEGDPYEHEEPTRRLIRFWHDGAEVRATIPRQTTWERFGIKPDESAAFDSAWKLVWSCLDSDYDIHKSSAHLGGNS